ncbi:FAD-dependent oxidoreductase [Candidatus Wolfebacteria bacterium]|nr:FAD-dependent oxidoreductase [Candidatus Wolfebacteria bacterium]
MLYDLIIIGGGPAGVAAGIYAARKKIKSLLIAESFGGQSVIAAQINNFIGFKSISGLELKNVLEEHLRVYEDIEIKEGAKVEKIEAGKSNGNFSVILKSGEIFQTKTILLAAGSNPRRLQVPGEEKFEGKGVFYCSTCDAPFLKDKVAAVVGGGNSAFYAVFDLLPYASKIYVLSRGETLKADPIYIDKARSSGKVEIINFAEAKEILGDKFVSALRYEDKKSGEIKTLEVGGIFVEIGYQPNSNMIKGLADINQNGKIVVNCETQATSCKGIWAAGDISSVLYGQINIAIGDGIKAVLNIYDYLKNNK